MLSLQKNTSNKNRFHHTFESILSIFLDDFSFALIKPICGIFLLIFRRYNNNCPVFFIWPKTAHVSLKRIRTEFLHVLKIIFTEIYALVMMIIITVVINDFKVYVRSALSIPYGHMHSHLFDVWWCWFLKETISLNLLYNPHNFLCNFQSSKLLKIPKKIQNEISLLIIWSQNKF